MLANRTKAVEQCDHTLTTYASVVNWAGQEHGALAMTRLLRAMAIAAQDTDSPTKGLAAYDAFLQKYPTGPNAATAWLNRGMLQERFGNASDAVACYLQAVAVASDSPSGRDAASRIPQSDPPASP